MVNLVNEFPINHESCYLNNAAYTPIPQNIIDEILKYLSLYSLKGPDSGSVPLDELLEKGRYCVSGFLGCSVDEVVFTQSITHGINIIAEGFDYSRGNNIVVREAEKEHVANYLPWLKVSKEKKLKLFISGSDSIGIPNIKKMERYMNLHKGGILSITHALYNIGTILPLDEIIKVAHNNGYFVFIDAGQTAGVVPLDVKKMNCDFLAFSGYKWLCSPPGIGVLYIKKNIKKYISYYGMDVRSLASKKKGIRLVLDFNKEGYNLINAPNIFEAGFRNYVGLVGLISSIKFYNEIGPEKIRGKTLDLVDFTQSLLRKTIKNIKIYGPENIRNKTSIISFNIPRVNPTDLVAYLRTKNIFIAVREIGNEGIARISPHYFNTRLQLKRTVDLIRQYCIEQKISFS